MKSLRNKFFNHIISQFIQGMSEENFSGDAKTKAAVERKIEIIGEALNQIKAIDSDMLARIDNWREITGFRNVIAHGYNVVEDEIVWESIINDISLLLSHLKDMATNGVITEKRGMPQGTSLESLP